MVAFIAFMHTCTMTSPRLMQITVSANLEVDATFTFPAGLDKFFAALSILVTALWSASCLLAVGSLVVGAHSPPPPSPPKTYICDHAWVEWRTQSGPACK